jgi:hypothetical protein
MKEKLIEDPRADVRRLEPLSVKCLDYLTKIVECK